MHRDYRELFAYIDRWKVNNQDVSIKDIITAIGLWKSGTGCTVPACSEGQIISSCTCGGTVYLSGYCCSGAWQSGSCGAIVDCVEGQQITSTCICEGSARASGYCCIGSDHETLGPCCPNGPIPSSGCYCNEQYGMRYDNYCCDNYWTSAPC